MRTKPMWRAAAVAASVTAALGGAAATSAATGQPGGEGQSGGVRHVLLISVDGLHQQDLAWYVKNNLHSVLAALDHQGVEYGNAETPFPSDSFPGMVGQVTGGDPRVTGVYYDDTWNHDVFPAGTTDCSGPVPGGEVAYTEADDIDQTRLDAGQGLAGLPGSILQMTGDPLQVIDQKNLPVDPASCKPINPNQYLKVNTIFNVARDHGLRTAWSDKHPAYQILSGPSGTGVQDYFTPEINSQALGFPAGEDWTNDNAATMQYDSYKVQAILNEIDGLDHSGKQHAGVPAIFGMNFQTVSTAQKLPTSDGLTGGYLPGGTVPGPLLVRALNYIDA
jgi:Type I phosphodiesterase / nucleotide pyrophosphatase